MTSPDEITVELMQQILREAEKDNSILVLPDLEVHKLIDGRHIGSCLSRVSVKYTRQGDTSQHSLSLLVKAVPQSSSIAEIVQESSHFVREIQMFDEILPRMSTLLSRALPDSHEDFSARVYYTRKTPRYLIAMEDLTTKSFKAPVFKNGFDLKHCLLTLRTLARFHAASVMIREEDERLFAVFDKYSFLEKGTIDVLNNTFSKILTVVTLAMESSPEFGRSWADRLRQRSQTLQDDLQLLMKRDDRAFNVLNHGDFAVHNVMYRHSETSGELEAVMLVDFQCCSYNSPVLDLHQFIFASADDDVRINHIDTLLKEYHSELTATLEALGAPPDQIISLSTLHEDFKSKLLYGLLYTLLTFLFTDIDWSNPEVAVGDIFNPSFGADKLQKLVTDTYLKRLKKVLAVFTNNKILYISKIITSSICSHFLKIIIFKSIPIPLLCPRL